MKQFSCAFALALLAVPASAYAEESKEPSFGYTLLQLQHMVLITSACRAEADIVVGQIKEEARAHNGEPVYNLLAPGIKVPMSETQFGDFYVLTCYPRRARLDPVLAPTMPVVEDKDSGLPGT